MLAQVSLPQLRLEILFVCNITCQTCDSCDASRSITDCVATIMNPALRAVGAANPVLSIKNISRAVAIEKDQRAIVVVGMDSIKPGMGISVEALAGASPNLLIRGADVKDALLDNIDQPEDVGESSGDLLERFGGFEQRAFSIDAANDFLVKGINGLLEE